MKTYVKPAMMALSISANDMLCSGCSDNKLRDDESLKLGIIIANPGLDTNGDKTLNFNEGGQLFSIQDNGENSCGTKIEYEGYCKFTGTTQIMWS